MKVLPPPGPARTRQLALLAVLLVAAAYAVFRVIGGNPAIAPPSASNSATRPAPPVEPTKDMPEPLELDKLDPLPEPPPTVRNPFRFGVAPPPAGSPSPPSGSVPPAMPPGMTTPPVAAVPPIPLKFIGRVVLPDRSVVASLSDGRGNVFQGIEGQIVDGRYRIVRIGEESLVVEYANGTGRTTLPLKGS